MKKQDADDKRCSSGNGDISGATAAAHSISVKIDIVSFIAAWVLAIVSRAKYRNTFSLVLIIIYSCLLAVSVIGIIAAVFFLMGWF